MISENVAYLRQGLALLDRLADDAFVCAPPGERVGGVGPQLRHVIDYYRCFLRDVRSGRVDYDRRERDPDVETSRAAAAARVRELISELEALEGVALPAELQVKADRDPLLPESELWACSSVRRELMFLASHTVHHFAIVAITLAGHDVSVGKGFGVAPSTLRHWQETGSPAPQS
jgi:hypothetical protein